MTDEKTEQNMIADIKRLLDTVVPDRDTRAALQQARIQALTSVEKRQPMPWLGLAVAVSLAGVVAVNLTQTNIDTPSSSVKAVTQKPVSASRTKAVSNYQPDNPTSASTSTSTTQAKPVADQASALDMDLLENLDLYEDTEFYEWLSDQEAQGGIDA